jgi:electron transfer flavoprotein beta subunit
MNIIVCLKQVPDPESLIDIDSNSRLIFADDIKWITNPFDEYGLEAALRIKDKYAAKITALSVGPRRALQPIRTALAMGADEGLLILDEDQKPWNSMAVAGALFAAIKDLEFDLIFTGQRGIDSEMGIVGPCLAGYLDVACLSQTVKIEISTDERSIRTNSLIDGRVSILEADLPTVVCIEKGLNEPRFFSLADLRQANKKKIKQKALSKLSHNHEVLLHPDRNLNLVKLTPIFDKRSRIIIEGETPEEKAANLARILKSEEKVI